MVSFKQNNDCTEAELFYYDFFDNKTEDIPENILKHIMQCQHCQSNIEELENQLGGADTEQIEANFARTELLKQHFSYINKKITCQIVKPFLPTLLHPSLPISIPTPITTHIDNCFQCSNGLEKIKSLGLNDKQLMILNKILSEPPAFDWNSCKKTQLDLQGIAQLDWNGSSSCDSFKHCCVCPNCRDILFKKRQEILEQIGYCDQWSGVPCDAVQNEDIFNYCFPYDIDPLNDEYSMFRKNLSKHLITCPTCLEKMQKLHNTISEIATRKDSGVVTKYTQDDTGKSGDYEGYPIKIQKEMQGDNKKLISIPLKLSKKSENIKINIQPLLKFTAAAAIVLVVSSFFLFNSPANAFSLKQMYKAIASIKNVYISKYLPESKKPIEEKFVSREFNKLLIKNGNKIVEWHIDSNQKIVEINQIEKELTLSKDDIEKVNSIMKGSLGLMPFEFVCDVPKNAIWQQNKSKDELGFEYYSLIWSQKKIAGEILYKWNIQVDPVSYFPQKCSLLKKAPEDKDFKLIRYVVIKYPRPEEIEKILKEF